MYNNVMDIENDLSYNLEYLYPETTYTNNLFKTFNINPLFYIYRNTENNGIEDGIEDEDADEDAHEDEYVNDDCSNYDEDNVSYISTQTHTIREYNTVNFVFRKWKIFTMGSFVAITASYVAGLVVHGEFDRYIQSYDHEGLVLGMIEWWPSCRDRREELWRLVSCIFSHANLNHYTSNIFAMIGLSFMLELYQPAILILPLFLASTIHGNLSFYYAKPYYYAIGVSQGVFGILGMNFANGFLNVHELPILHSAIILYVCFAMVCGEILSYDESNNIAYICHWGSLISGFLGGMACLKQYNPYKNAIYIRGIFLVLYILFGGFLFYHYTFEWPPLKSYTNTLQLVEPKTCCQQYFIYENIRKHLNTSNVETEPFRCVFYGSVSQMPSYYKSEF